MAKKYTRVAPPANVHEAWDRVREAETIVTLLKAVRTRGRQFPATHKKIHSAVKSAEGAVRHANRVYMEHYARERRDDDRMFARAKGISRRLGGVR